MAGTITALRFQKGNAERVNVYLDGQYALALPALEAARLKPGQFLSDADLLHLQAIDEEARAYERALRFLAYRPRSRVEAQRHLQKHGHAADAIEAALERLAAAKYLDDEAFARFWVNDRERFNPRGARALRHELRQKGVADAIIDRTLEAVNAEESAYRAGIARARRLRNLDEPAFRQKLGSYLLRRGFNHSAVWPVVDRIWQSLQQDSSD